MFSPQSAFRRLCHRISRNTVWDTLIIMLIVVSSICLAIDSPRLAAAAASGSPFEVQVSWWLEKLNLYFTVLFTFELMFKVAAHPNPNPNPNPNPGFQPSPSPPPFTLTYP